MSAPAPLPPCPLLGCNGTPVEGWGHTVGQSPRYTVGCYGSDHKITVNARTKVAAMWLWRRIAGGAR